MTKARVCIARWCEYFANCQTTVKPEGVSRVVFVAHIPTGEWCLHHRPLTVQDSRSHATIKHIQANIANNGSQIGNDRTQIENTEAA